MDSILIILKQLEAGFGKHDVANACRKYLNSLEDGEGLTLRAAAEEPQEKEKEKKPRGKSSWNLEVDKVLAEMRLTNPSVTYKVAFSEAGRRKRDANPEAQMKYDAYRKKVESKKEAKKEAKKETVSTATAELPRLASSTIFGEGKDENPRRR